MDMNVLEILLNMVVENDGTKNIISTLDALKAVIGYVEEDDFGVLYEKLDIDFRGLEDLISNNIGGVAVMSGKREMEFKIKGKVITVYMTDEMHRFMMDLDKVCIEKGQAGVVDFFTVVMEAEYSIANSFIENVYKHFYEENDSSEGEDFDIGVEGETLGELLRSTIDIGGDEGEIEELEKESRVARKILFRRKEINLLNVLTAKKFRKNILIVGKSGVGKDALLQEFIRGTEGEVAVVQLKRSDLKMPLVALIEREGNRAKKSGKKYVYLRELERLANNLDDKSRDALCSTVGSISGAIGINYILTFDSEKVMGNGEFDKIVVKPLEPENAVMVVWNDIEEMLRNTGVTMDEGLMTNFIKGVYTGSIDRLLDAIDTLIVVAQQLFKGNLNKQAIDYYYESVRVQSDTRAEDGGVKELQGIRERIESRLIGQAEAVDKVVRAIRRNKAGVRVGNRPVGTFLFVGPTGVGKTELVKVLARELNGTENSIIRFDMSEFSEGHSVSKLIGSPPGYVGHDDGGQLTKRIKERPNSIVLFDEIEKAHGNVFNMLLQIMDEGRLTDSKGDTVDFTKAIIVMTSNAGYSEEVSGKRNIGFTAHEFDENKMANEQVLTALESTFRPEFLNRIDSVVKFNRLQYEEILAISKLLIGDVVKVVEKSGYKVEVAEEVYGHISKAGFSVKYGARNIKRAIQEEIEDYLADCIIDEKMGKERKYTLSVEDGKVVFN